MYSEEGGALTAKRIAVTGAAGRMGREVIKGLMSSVDFSLSAAVDVTHIGEDVGLVSGVGACGISISNNLESILRAGTVDAVIDFTTPKVVMANIEQSLACGVPILVGTTGLTSSDVDDVKKLSEQTGTGCIIAPNFTIGAILMMLFAQTAAKYFPNVEIIELHHNQKVDAPSGTALKTAELIAAARRDRPSPPDGEFEKLAGARGGALDGIHLHAVRLPGFIAHQEVIFGDTGQILTIRHDSMSRECYVPGVMMALRHLFTIDGVVYGLENLI